MLSRREEDHDMIVQLERNLRSSEDMLNELFRSRDSYSNDRDHLLRELTNLTVESDSFQAQLENETLNLNNLRREVARLEADVESEQEKLFSLQPEFDVQNAACRDVEDRLSLAQQRQQQLYSKQGRNAEFESAAHRDDWLRSQISSREEQLLHIRDQRDQLKMEIEYSHSEIASTEEYLTEREETIAMRKEEIERLKSGLEAKIMERNSQNVVLISLLVSFLSPLY